MDELELIESFKAAPATSVAEVLARAAAMPDPDEIRQAAAERAAADARAEERETQMMLNRRAGDPLGQLSRAESVAAELRAEVLDLETRLEAARARLRWAAESVVDFRAAADEVMSTARRSDSPDLLAEAKRLAAEVRVEQMLAQRSAHAAGPPRQAVRSRVPFDGEAVRSEHCVYCTQEGLDDYTSYLLHSDPEYAVPVTTPEQAEQAAAERRAVPGSYREIAR